MSSFSETRKKLAESTILYAQGMQGRSKKAPDTKAPDQALDKIKTTILSRQKDFDLNDGTKLSVDEKDAEAIAACREDLNVNNRELFDSMLCENIDTFACALEFARKYAI
jgi:hypothetical protein